MNDNRDVVQYVEDVFGVKLLDYQKELLRQMKSGKQFYICPAHHMGFTLMRQLMEAQTMKCFMKNCKYNNEWACMYRSDCDYCSKDCKNYYQCLSCDYYMDENIEEEF